MKKIVVYLLGVLTGFVITSIAILVIHTSKPEEKSVSGIKTEINSKIGKMKGVTLLDQPGEVIESSSVKVFQSLDAGIALAHCESGKSYDPYGGSIVLLYIEGGNPYYDDQIISVPSGKCFRQIGVFNYSAFLGEKTVPVVTIMDY